MHLWVIEILISLLFALGGICFFILSASFSDLATNPLDVGSRAFPRLMILLILIFAVWQIIHSIRHTRPEGKKLDFGNIPATVSGTFILAAYIFLLKEVGYYIITPFFIFFLQLIQGSRKWIQMILISICFTVFAYLVFSKFLGVALP